MNRGIKEHKHIWKQTKIMIIYIRLEDAMILIFILN